MTGVAPSAPSAPPVGAAKTGGRPDDLQASAAVLADESGRYSDDQKLAAWEAINAQWSSLPNASSTDRAAVDSALNASSFVKRMQAAQNAFIQTLNANGNRTAKSSDALRADVAAFDALSAGDRKLVEPAFNGQSGDEWRALTLARAGLAKISEDAASGVIKPGDPRISQARDLDSQIEGKVVSASTLNSWTQAVQAFLGRGAASPAVKVDLSDDAKTYMEQASKT